ncbi:WD40-repeat-containing domain protein [Pilobolus umbonatus]|nr:WD40-repeat-containing domain protein [Pilobolus umbonatus]
MSSLLYVKLHKRKVIVISDDESESEETKKSCIQQDKVKGEGVTFMDIDVNTIRLSYATEVDVRPPVQQTMDRYVTKTKNLVDLTAVEEKEEMKEADTIDELSSSYFGITELLSDTEIDPEISKIMYSEGEEGEVVEEDEDEMEDIEKEAETVELEAIEEEEIIEIADEEVTDIESVVSGTSILVVGSSSSSVSTETLLQINPSTSLSTVSSTLTSVDMVIEEEVTPTEDTRPPELFTFQPKDKSLFELLVLLDMHIESVSEPDLRQTLSDEPCRVTRHQNSRLLPLPDPSPKPYVPCLVWLNSLWEDWAQLKTGSILHWPFTPVEQDLIAHLIGRFSLKKKLHGLKLWDYVASMLPGRTAMDCECFWEDHTYNHLKVHQKPVIIRKRKVPNVYSWQKVLLARESKGRRAYRNVMKSIAWSNMQRESLMTDGSGDAIALLVYGDELRGDFVAVGSLCDENVQYNMPGNLRLWSSESKKQIHLNGHYVQEEAADQADIWRTVTDLKLSRNKDLIFSASHDGTAKVWRANDGRCISTLKYHSQGINQLAVHEDIDQNILATASNDGTATVWMIDEEGKTGAGSIVEPDDDIYVNPVCECVEFGNNASRDMIFLGIRNGDIEMPGSIIAFDLHTSEAIMTFRGMGGCISAMAISSDGTQIISGNYNNQDYIPGDRMLHLNDIRLPNSVINFYTDHADVNIAAFSPCGTYVASGNASREDGEVVIFDVRKPDKRLHSMKHSQHRVNQRLIAPDSSVGIGGFYWMSNSRTVITGGGDSLVKVWNIQGELDLLQTYQGSNCITSLTVNEDRMIIAAGVAGSQGVVHIWQP